LRKFTRKSSAFKKQRVARMCKTRRKFTDHYYVWRKILAKKKKDGK